MAEKIKNPFIHSHDDDCDHDHGHSHEPFEPADPAQQSLADAMRVSFGILKLIMILLLLFYAFSGTFAVKPQEQVVRTWFGKIIGEEGEEVYKQGWYLGAPYPFEQKIKVPITQRSVSIRSAFWYEVTERQAALTPDQLTGGPLNPEKDGSLLTGDANIVHGRFQVNYKINNAVDFVENVGDVAFADELVTNIAEQGIVYAVAQVKADDFINSQLNSSAAIQRMQRVLDKLQTGITIEDLLIRDSTPPLAVRKAYFLVTDADSEKGQKISAARQQRTTLLNEAAGEAHGPLFEMVKAYELARSVNDAQQSEALDQQIATAFSQLRTPAESGGAVIGGEASELINQANTYRTEVVEQVKAEANSFVSQLDRYRESPNLTSTRMWQKAREKIFTGDVETFYTSTGQTQIITNVDPAVSRKREQDRIEQAEIDAAQSLNP